MHTLSLFVLDGWSALIKSNPGSCKLLSSHEISELGKVSERHKMSHSFFYKYTGKLGWSSICLRFYQFEPEIMLDGMLNLKTHFMVWYYVWCEHCNGLF